ncbi:universal stress protein [Streptomyces umbrinus]|uniref:universal stress protein n=1 Tax=Streptomyces umbrinus TaxID=67370 RepID=UPI0033FC28B1
MTGSVVVGLDGSAESITAAWWAAREALDRHLPVLLLHSWTTQPLDVPVAQAASTKQQYGRDVLRTAEADILHRYGDLELSTELVSAPASRALLDRSENAAMLVLGSRGHGTVSSFLLGSISLHVLGLARCPTVTVRADDPAIAVGRQQAAAIDRNEIVVGVKNPGPASDRLLEFAFTTAESHAVPVRVVRALPRTSPIVRPRPASAQHSDSDEEDREHERLTGTLAPWRAKFPTVTAVEHIATGPAAQVLLTAAAHGRLTVIGRRLHPSHLTWKLGPVAHGALHHLPCPIAVVPHD